MNANVKTEEPIRIAQIMGKLWAGGVEAVVFNYYREIDKSRVQFDFYYDADSTVEPPQELIDMGARFYKVPPYQDFFAYIRTLKCYLGEGNYTIVHSHINTLSVFPLYVAKSVGIPIRIAHNHSVPGGNEVRRNVLKYILKLFSKIYATDYFACSEKAGRWLFGNRAFESGRVYVVRNAIDYDKFIPISEEVETLKESLELKGKFVIGHIGRFTYAKNHKFLIDLFNLVHNQREDARLLLVGDGELHDEICVYIEEKNLKDYVVLVGQVSNPEKYYGIVDVMVLPSLYEGLSLTAIESQIAGIPVVISENIPDEAVISDGCSRCSLGSGMDEWIRKIYESEDKLLVLDDKSKEYDIRIKSPELLSRYLDRMAETL